MKMRVLIHGLIIGLFVALWVPAGRSGEPQFADAWSWQLPPRLFGTLSQDHRTQFGLAEKLLREGQHHAAAVEFEKFLAQTGRTPVRPHALLLQAYSLHLARQRNAAIALYTELMDFYAESVDQAVPALFLMGWAHRQNGNTELAIQTWERLVEKETYHAHPLSDRARIELANHYLRQGDARKAERQWELIVQEFVNAFVRPERSAVEAHQQLTRMAIREGRYGVLDQLLEKQVPFVRSPAPDQKADYAFELAAGILSQLEPAGQRQFFGWFRGKQAVYGQANRADAYFEKTMQLAVRMRLEEDWRAAADGMLQHLEGLTGQALAAPAQRMAGQMVAAGGAEWNVSSFWQRFINHIRTTGQGLPVATQLQLYRAVLQPIPRNRLEATAPESQFWDALIARKAEIYGNMLNPERDSGLAGLVDRLIQAGIYDVAQRMTERIENRPFGMVKLVQVLLAQEKWEQAAAICEEIEAADTGRHAAWAIEKRAELYAQQLGRHAEAITLYRAINDPPRTLWAIIDSQEKMGALQEAAATCTELENFFPDEAPQAAYRRAMIWHRANDRERAIAAFRAVLRQYPRHAVAAQAHQMQEQYEFDFGGGVIEEME